MFTSNRRITPQVGFAALGFAAFLVAGAQTASAQSEPPKVASATSSSGSTHKLDPAIRVAKSALASAKKLKDYKATFSKREVVKNQLVSDSIFVKIRNRPFSVYMLYTNQHRGREVLYVEGKNDGKLLAHDSGIASLVGTVALAPTGSQAMEESRYPVTRMGIVNLAQGVIDQWQSELVYKDVELKYYPQAKLGDVQCKVIETSHGSRKEGVKFQTTRLYIERKTNLPVRVEQFGFPNRSGVRGPLIEEYTYSDIVPNQSMSDFDFDPQNQDYAF